MKLKKLLVAFSVLAASACMALGFVACGETPAPPPEECVHEFGRRETVREATCLEEGLRTRTCALCGYVEESIITRKDHDMSRRQGKEPTCTEIGWAEYEICMYDCGTTTYREIPALGHDLKLHERVAATCTEVGYESWLYCDRKGCDYSEQMDHFINALGHDYGPYNAQICSRCGSEPYFPSEGLDFNLDSKNNWYEVVGIGRCKDEEIVIPETYQGRTVKVIAAEAFAGDKGLKSVRSRTVTKIGENAFANSTIESIQFDKLAEFGSQVFTNCLKLTTFTIPATVTTFDFAIFDGCTNLVELKVDPTSQHFYAKNNCVISRSDNSVVLGIANSVIPEGVKGIAHNAFMRVPLTEIEIPDSVETIATWAFGYCTSLTKVTIGENASINWQAFGYCTSLTKVVIKSKDGVYNPDVDDEAPENAVSRNISYDAFFACSMLSEIEFQGTKAEFLSLVGTLTGGLKGTYNPMSPSEYTSLADYKHYTVECTDGALKEAKEYNSFAFEDAERLEFKAEYIEKVVEFLNNYSANMKEQNAELADEIDAIVVECMSEIESAATVYDAYKAYRSAVNEVQRLIDANADAE